ncbi:MAG: tyrosine recombinase XerC [Burkholderiaceae bacterium]|nr:tyrosine recombinase XerC [Burkholderiaceae bacterium]
MDAADSRTRVDSYLEQLRTQRQLSEHTVRNYGRDLDELLRLAEPALKTSPLTTLTHFHIRKFAAQLHANGLSPRSIARKLSCWRGFFNWLADRESGLPNNPVEGVKAPKRGKPLPKALAADDAVHLVAHRNGDTTLQRCNQAMFELLYSSGLRVSELAGLDVRYTKEAGHSSAGWIDFEAREVTVTGKGSRMRSVPIGGAAMAALADWLAVRPSLVKADPAPLFLSERGSRISARVVQLRLKAHARTLGMAADVHPHMLRHSFASHVLQSSGDLRAVQEMLGHASISATQVYTSLDFQRLAQVYDAAHPKAKKKASP